MSYAQSEHVAHSAGSVAAAGKLLDYAVPTFNPGSYIELGAGFGHWARAAMDRGVASVLAVDGPWTDLEMIRVPRRNYRIADLTASVDFGRRFDMALSLEVAEHIDPASADIFVDNLVRHSDLVIFGAAIPGQGGYLHVNEQWPSYWADKFASRGYRLFDVFRSRFWSEQDMPVWYRQNTFLFVNQGRDDLIAIAASEASGQPVDAVHPELFANAIEIVGLKKLLARLPAMVLRRLIKKVTSRTA
jgi:hypothetical protein